MVHHDHTHSRHEHGHSRAHGDEHRGGAHAHQPAAFGRAFAVGISLNLLYVAAEAFYGISAHSLALLADAAHNLGDVLALAAAWGAAILGRLRPTARHTYGLRSSSILVALGNAIMLLVITGGLAWEAIKRLFEPGAPAALTIIIVATVGIAVNGVTALLFQSGRRQDLNIRAAFMHMAADALIAAGVAVGGAVILVTGQFWVDPALSLVLAVVIVAGTWSLLRDSLNLALHAVPEGIDPESVRFHLASLPGVAEVHDLHIWAMSTTETALPVHLVCSSERDDELPKRAAIEIKRQFGIGHCTIQLETDDGNIACELAPDHVP